MSSRSHRFGVAPRPRSHASGASASEGGGRSSPGLAWAVLCLALAGCVGLPHVVESDNPLWANASGAVQDDELGVLSVDIWEETLRAGPTWASRLGDERYLGKLPDRSPYGVAQHRRRLAELLTRAELIYAGELTPDDQVTLAMARRFLRNAILMQDAHLERWVVSPRSAPHVALFSIAQDQPAGTARERAALLERWSAMGQYIRDASANLRLGLKRGMVANQTSVVKTLEQLDRVLARPIDEWPLAEVELSPTLPALSRKVLAEKIDDLLEREVKPALEEYRYVLRLEVLPEARGDDAPGLASLPGGLDLYDELIEYHTGLELTADELHETGLEEVARIRSQMSVLGQRVFGTDDVAEIQRRLRDDPALHFATREEVEQTARDSLARAATAMDGWFGLQPEAPCEVVRIPEVEERDTTIAYYRGPAADGSLPGRYFINTYAPETRPRYEAEVLAFHEAIPGHHLQIAIASERDGLPAFQRHMRVTAYAEGWGLYTERLSDEMGLYSGDLDRLGVLSFDAWRACRLVVDTGLHAMGWSRGQAIDYMYANTLLARNNIENEVDRYITTPGQALAYKVGQLEILDMREDARRRLGPEFDVRDFHDVVLKDGGVTLDLLRRNVDRWVDGELARLAAEAEEEARARGT